jgi:hypothetical protein
VTASAPRWTSSGTTSTTRLRHGLRRDDASGAE